MPQEGIAVTFHVLVPIAPWGWSSATKLAIVFGDRTLGQWKLPVGEFSIRFETLHVLYLPSYNISYRKLSDGMMEACSTITIRASLLKDTKQLPYKYVVYSEDDSKLKYEYLHGAHSTAQHVNRCLIVPVAYHSEGGM